MRDPGGARRIGARLVPAALAVIAAACGGRQPPDYFQEEGDAAISLRVDNNNFNDATLWVLADGARRRLGIVGGNTRRTFRIPWTGVRTVRVEVDLLAGGGFTTDPLSVERGEELDLVIPPGGDHSP